MPATRKPCDPPLVPDQPVLELHHDSIDAETAWDLRPLLLRALYTFGPKLQVDISRVRFIDSTGLGLLVGILGEARELDGEVQLVRPSPEVLRILRVTGLDSVFAVRPAGGRSCDDDAL